jgi:hypothetical protein
MKTNKKISLESGTNKQPLKRLNSSALKKELLKQAAQKPIVLEKGQYEEWLEHTVLARIKRGENALDEVKAKLQSLAKSSGSSDKKEILAAIAGIDQSIVSFQYSALKFNIMWRPSIRGEELANVELWIKNKI